MRFLLLLLVCASTHGLKIGRASIIGQRSVLFRLRETKPLFRESFGLSTALQLRGGQTPTATTTEAATEAAIQFVSPELAAKILTLAGLLQGSAFMLASPEAFEHYDVKNLNKMQQGAGEYFGAWKTSKSTAMGSAFAVWTLQWWRLLNRDYKIQNYFNCTPTGAMVVHLTYLVHTLCAYALLTNQDWATKLTKIWSYFGLLNGIVGILSPSTFAEAYAGQEGPKGDLVYSGFQRCGSFALAGCAVLLLALINDVDAFKAFGYASLVSAMHLVCVNFVTKEAKALGLDRLRNLHMTWLVVFAVLTWPLITKK